jgi:ribosomal protein S27AE
MLYWSLFFFLTVGAKLVLAALMIFLLLPSDRRCSRCDEETLLMRPTRLGRAGAWLSRGRVQRRWCPRCGWEGLARWRRERYSQAGLALDSTAPTRR